MKIRYPLAGLAFAGVMLFLCQLKARRQVGLLLRNGPSIRKFEALFVIESFPHGDTLDAGFSNLEVDQIQTVVSTMTGNLIRKKVLYSYRILGTYFIVAVDGTGTVKFDHRHCPHCLTRTHNGKTLYYHPVLEAKLLTSNGFAFSLMTEFIENPGDQATKQACELKAFYRLAERLKRRFPRLPILLSMDGVVVGHSVGFKGPNIDEFLPEHYEEIVRSGGKVLKATILTHSLETSLADQFKGSAPTLLIANTLRRLGQGLKVYCEIVMEAVDAGLIPEGAEVVAVGGTARGWDAVVPEHLQTFEL